MNIDSSLGQPYESIPVDFGTSLNWSSAHWHDQGATSDSDHDMEVRNRSSTLSQSGSPTSSMTPPEIQSNAHGNWFHPTFYSNPFNQSAITPADAPSTSGFSGISINEPSSSKTALGHCFLPGAVPAPHSRGQHQELYTAPYPQTGGYPIYNYGLPFSAEDADYEKTSEAVRPSREDYGQSFDDNKIFSKRAQEKLAKSKELRARRRNAATNPSASGSGSTSRHMIASINRSLMENPGFPYYYASNTHHSRKGLADANSQSIVDSGRCPPTEDTVRGRDPASHDLSTLRNMQEAEVSGVFVNTSAPLEVSVYHGVSSMPPPNNGLAHNYSSTVATPESSEHSGYEIYYKYLSVKQRGTPLWEPGPHLRLPPTYRENGVSIGDVGILNSTMGTFIFLFNIFLSASHEINRGRVPHGFRPLDRSKAEQSLKENDIYDRCLASSSLKRTDSSDFAFETTGREGAVLVMPNGGLSEDLENYKLLKSHIASYAESWWEYVESEDCGVPTENGIQVVVGTDKVSSWGMTTFENVIEPMKFEFNSEGIASQTRTSNWKGINGRAGPTEKEIGLLTGPTASPLRNQCVFVRTLNVSVPGKVRDKLAIEVCASCSRDCMCDSSRHEGQPRQRNVEIQASQVGLSQVSHPSKLLNRYLLEKCPNAKVVITCDLDWIRVITENDTTMPSAEDICARILSSHTIYEKKGVVTLGKWQNIVSAGDDPSVTGSGSCNSRTDALTTSVSSLIQLGQAPRMDPNRHRSGRPPPNPGHSRSESHGDTSQSLHDLLPSSTSTWGENIGSISMSQPQNMVNAPVGGGTVVNVTVNHEDAPTTNARHERLHDLTSTGQADHEIYCNQLLIKKRGSPLWVPGPGMQLPIEYRRQGISIGDIGIITSLGFFDFLFNIFQPANHPTNRRRVPQGFSPLPFQEFVSDIHITMDYGPDTYLASSSVRKISTDWDIGTSVDAKKFESTAKEAAILIMPDGATTQDLFNTRGIRSTIASNAKDWYTYARDTGRDVKNGDIRVVVGVDKVTSWGMATSSCTTGQTASYVFKHDPIHTYKWDCIGGSGRVGPQKIEIHDLIEDNAVPQNQSVFVRTINFTLSGKTWNDPPLEAVQQQSGLRSGESGRRGSTPSNQRGPRGGPGVGSTPSAGSMPGSLHCMSPSVHFDPINHPSTTLHNYLHKKFPDVDMVITEDTDWISVLSDDDTVLPEPKDLCERMLKAHELLNNGGIIQLLRGNDTKSRQSVINLGTRSGNHSNISAEKVEYADRVALSSRPERGLFEDVPPINPHSNPLLGHQQTQP